MKTTKKTTMQTTISTTIVTIIKSSTMISTEGIKQKQQWAVKLYFEYFYGKPQQRVDVTTNEESLNVPLINFISSES